jgi:hypothetical protein
MRRMAVAERSGEGRQGRDGRRQGERRQSPRGGRGSPRGETAAAKGRDGDRQGERRGPPSQSLTGAARVAKGETAVAEGCRRLLLVLHMR